MMKTIVTIACLLLFAPAFSQRFPFPQHITYAAGSIAPNTCTQAQLDDAVRQFYNQWKARYLLRRCDTTQYYIWYNDLGYDGNELCVSEGQGYGMVIVAEMAGYDEKSRQYFDGLYRWYKAHPSSVNPLLMNWRQNKECASDGDDSATDGDEDIAFALLLADAQWGSAGDINYLEEAKKIINGIFQSEVYTQSSYALQLGDWSHESTQYKDGTRPSDFMLDHFPAFAKATGNWGWLKTERKCYSLIADMQTHYSPNSGLMPDFIQQTGGSPKPARPLYLESKWDGNYNYNSCRTPWRIGCDFLVHNNGLARTACRKTNAFIQQATGGNPANIRSGYFLSGKPLPNSNYQDLSFIAPFGVSAMTDAANQSWLNALWTYITGVTDLGRDGYYGNTIKMQCLLVMSRNWWVPDVMKKEGDLITRREATESQANGFSRH